MTDEAAWTEKFDRWWAEYRDDPFDDYTRRDIRKACSAAFMAGAAAESIECVRRLRPRSQLLGRPASTLPELFGSALQGERTVIGLSYYIVQRDALRAEVDALQAENKRLRESLTVTDVEALSAELHAIYQAEARRQAGTGDDTVRHPDDYAVLAEHTKEYDRVLARFILKRESALQARVTLLEGLLYRSRAEADECVRAGHANKHDEGLCDETNAALREVDAALSHTP